MRLFQLLPILIVALPLLAQSRPQDTSPQALLEAYSVEAGGPPSAENGKALFFATHSGGKPDTPSCTSCHKANPRQSGQVRTGKIIDPLAPAANPERFTNRKFVEKWFDRNCKSVVGRRCSAQEKADIIAWLIAS